MIIKNKITIVLPCYNAEHSLEVEINCLKNKGFKNILVIDDGSKDKTYSVAERAKVRIIKNKETTNFNLAVLKGLYYVETPIALVLRPDILLQINEYLDEFIEFGIIGNYSLLISQNPSISGFRARLGGSSLSRVLMKKIGIFIGEPDFSAVFLDEKILARVKSSVSGTGSFVYFDILKEAIKNTYKIGVYPIGLTEREISHSNFFQIFQIILRMDYHQMDRYFGYSFPDLDAKRIRIDVTIAVIGYLIIRFFEWIIQTF